jgi:hypothetical protein
MGDHLLSFVAWIICFIRLTILLVTLHWHRPRNPDHLKPTIKTKKNTYGLWKHGCLMDEKMTTCMSHRPCHRGMGKKHDSMHPWLPFWTSNKHHNSHWPTRTLTNTNRHCMKWLQREVEMSRFCYYFLIFQTPWRWWTIFNFQPLFLVKKFPRKTKVIKFFMVWHEVTKGGYYCGHF